MENRYYVCNGTIGISHYDMTNDSMSAMAASNDESKWVKFTMREAEEVVRSCGGEWRITAID